MQLPQLAFRNLFRNRRRTLINVAGTAFAAAIMIIYGSLLEGILDKMVENLTDMELGQAQIHHADYRSDPDLYKTIPNSQEILKQLEQLGIPATGRLYGFALGSSTETSVGVQLIGIDPVGLNQVVKVGDMVRSGSWLTGTTPDQVVMGKVLAKNLGLKVGQELVVFGQAADGSLASDLLRVAGILGGVNSAIDRAGAFISISKYREFFLIEENVHEIVIQPPKDHHSDAWLGEVRAALADQKNVEVLSWQQLKPMMAEMLAISSQSMAFMILLIYFALGLLIINSTFMTIFERSHELGVMRAVGMLPWQIVALILWESFWQMLVASSLAIVIASPVCWYLVHNGIDLRGFMDNMAVAGMSLEPIWYAKVTLRSYLEPIIYLVLVVVFSCLYPAVKAARVDPVTAIYDR